MRGRRELWRGGDCDVLLALCAPLCVSAGVNERCVGATVLAQKDESAIAALIELTRDVNRDVRDWATFGLAAMIDVDTPPIRDALRARLTDEDGDTRHEALGGLARRKDADAIVMIGDWLVRGEISEPLMQAAAEAANLSLCEGLRRARERSLVQNKGRQNRSGRHLQRGDDRLRLRGRACRRADKIKRRA